MYHSPINEIVHRRLDEREEDALERLTENMKELAALDEEINLCWARQAQLRDILGSTTANNS